MSVKYVLQSRGAARIPEIVSAKSDDELLTAKDTAERIGVQVMRLHRAIKAGVLRPDRRVGRILCFRAARFAEIREIIAAHKPKTRGPSKKPRSRINNMATQAITLGFRSDGTSGLIHGPDVPSSEQEANVEAMNASGALPAGFVRVEVWAGGPSEVVEVPAR